MIVFDVGTELRGEHWQMRVMIFMEGYRRSQRNFHAQPYDPIFISSSNWIHETHY